MDSIDNAQKELQELIALIKKLRAPDGCPWDQKQTKQDIGKYLLDESYEVLDALAENNPQHIQEELGDLLFQILFIAEIASQSGEFSLADVMAAIKEKMIRRHSTCLWRRQGQFRPGSKRKLAGNQKDRTRRQGSRRQSLR
ncbi:MAG: hypothetical protein MZV70_24675 [Desulfobacterales bacterium]|nr:hypothetical protein [Desulfobacterales bacterium]